MSAPRSSHRTIPAHRVGGRYVLRAEIGRGGMATVYRAVDTVLERQVAIKLPHAHLASDEAFLDRFRREARAAAALDHPNVVAVHDWGQDGDGRAFLVLQLVMGSSLRELLRHRGRLEPATAAAVLQPAADGIGAAHAAGFVHRDVKPENLLLGRDGTVRVTDFGLARAAASATSTFGADVLVGSPHYLAPEAVRGEPLDSRADVYALGVVLFECLTGRPPHEGSSPYATAMAHTASQIPPPSEVSLWVDDVLDDLVLSATAIDRDDRPDDATLFAAELATLVPDRYGVDLKALAREPTPGPPTNGSHAGTVRLTDDHRTTMIASVVGGRADPTEADLEDDEPADGDQIVDLDADLEAVLDAETDEPLVPPTDADLRSGEPTDDDADLVGRTEDDPAVADGIDVVDAIDAIDEDQEDDEDDEDDDADAGLPARRRRWPVAVVLVLALLAASAAAGYLTWDRVLAPVTPIPAVTGLVAADAVGTLESAGFEVTVGEEAVHDLDIPEGHVLSQDRTGEARQGTIVALVLSAGPRQVEVPEVIGVPVDDALAALRDDGLDPSVTEQHHEEAPEGTVIATDPPAGDMVDETSPVEVTVSLGRQPIDVPDLVGETLDDARAQAEELGLQVERADSRHDEGAPAGTILGQDPEPGQTLFRRDSIGVVVSDGPEPLEVPNLRGEHVDDAAATLRNLGFEVRSELYGGLGSILNPGRVFDQDPGPGATRHRGDTITLYAYEP